MIDASGILANIPDDLGSSLLFNFVSNVSFESNTEHITLVFFKGTMLILKVSSIHLEYF